MRAVIFDLDGTLADTLGDIAGAMNHVLAQFGMATHQLDDYRAWVGWGVRHLVDHALPVDALHRSDEATATFRQYYADNLVITTAPYPGVAELLDSLAGDFTLAVLSNKPQEMTRTIIETVFARWHFADVVGARPDVPTKPDPTSAIALATRLEVPPDSCVFVGDTEVDIETALAANMRAIGVDWGFRVGSTLAEAGAEAVLSHPRELLDLLVA